MDYKFVPITKAKADLLDLIRDIQANDTDVTVTKNGVPVAVILSIRKLESLLDTIEILSDERTMKALKRARQQARKGQWISYEEVFG